MASETPALPTVQLPRTFLICIEAVDEPGFSVAYARMCEVLQRKQVMAEVEVLSPSGETQKQIQQVNFRKLLLTRLVKLE